MNSPFGLKTINRRLKLFIFFHSKSPVCLIETLQFSDRFLFGIVSNIALCDTSRHLLTAFTRVHVNEIIKGLRHISRKLIPHRQFSRKMSHYRLIATNRSYLFVIWTISWQLSGFPRRKFPNAAECPENYWTV